MGLKLEEQFIGNEPVSLRQIHGTPIVEPRTEETQGSSAHSGTGFSLFRLLKAANTKLKAKKATKLKDYTIEVLPINVE